jgi:glycosyltransferase involved in cell wall biosynthesis
MNCDNQQVRVLYSFPHKLGAERICATAWHQVNGLAEQGLDVTVFPGVLHRPVAPAVKVRPTLSWRKLRISYKLFGTLRACAVHDYLVARHVEKCADQIDIIHAWPLAALRTLKTAARLGIPCVLERPNTHTRYAYEVVQNECKKLGVVLPPGYEHAYNAAVLEKEEKEYREAYRLLCPSDFVARTFLDYGFAPEKLARHSYGYDDKRFHPNPSPKDQKAGLTVLFAGICAVRKGLHYALEAWLKSPAHIDGTFLIAGQFLPDYAQRLSSMLSHPSVRVLGLRDDIPELMRKSDILILPSIEEGSALVTSEGRGCGCVLVVSDAAGAICSHMENALVHSVGDVEMLTEHLALLHRDRNFLARLRAASLRTASELTWSAACTKLHEVYRSAIEAKRTELRQHPLSWN